jgi:hypothetical protein
MVEESIAREERSQVKEQRATNRTSCAQGNHRMTARTTPPIPCAHREALPPFLALHPIPPPPPQARSAILWGDASVARVAARTAAAAVDRGVTVAVIDGAMAFDVTAIAAYAQARRVPPERFLKQIYIARAFTCHQVATLLCERLDPLVASQRVGLVILLGPCTTFFDENVPFKDAFLLFQRVLGKIEALCERGPLLLMAQALDRYRTRRTLFVRTLVKAVELGIRVYTVEGRRHVQLVKPRRPSQSWASPTI